MTDAFSNCLNFMDFGSSLVDPLGMNSADSQPIPLVITKHNDATFSFSVIDVDCLSGNKIESLASRFATMPGQPSDETPLRILPFAEIENRYGMNWQPIHNAIANKQAGAAPNNTTLGFLEFEAAAAVYALAAHTSANPFDKEGIHQRTAQAVHLTTQTTDRFTDRIADHYAAQAARILYEAKKNPVETRENPPLVNFPGPVRKPNY